MLAVPMLAGQATSHAECFITQMQSSPQAPELR